MTEIREAQPNKGVVDDVRIGDGAASSSTPFDALDLLKEGAASEDSNDFGDRFFSGQRENVPADERKAMGQWLQQNYDKLRIQDGIEMDLVSPNSISAVYDKGAWPDGKPLSDADKAMMEKIADHWGHLKGAAPGMVDLDKKAIDTIATATVLSTAGGEDYVEHADGRITVVRASGTQIDWSPDGNYEMRGTGGQVIRLKPDGTGYVESPIPGSLTGNKLRMDLAYQPNGEWVSQGEHAGVFKLKMDQNSVKFSVHDVEMEMTRDGKISARGAGVDVSSGPDGKLIYNDGKKPQKVWIEDGALCWSNLDGTDKDCDK